MSRKLSLGFIIAVAFGLLSATAPTKATTLDFNLGDLTTVGTPLIGDGSTSYNLTFHVLEQPASVPLPRSSFVNGALSYQFFPESTSPSNLETVFSFTSAFNGTLVSSGQSGPGHNNGNPSPCCTVIDSASLYDDGSLIETASLSTINLSGRFGAPQTGSAFKFAPIQLLAGNTYTLDIVGITGPTGLMALDGQLQDTVSAVPLPASLSLFGGAVLALGAVRLLASRGSRLKRDY
jgi:hypothetical protein